MEQAILFVDDEPDVLNAIKRMLIDENYDLHFAQSGQEGLKVLKKKDIQVIVSDMRMPEMDGVAFLKEAKKIAPDSIPIVLSAYTDTEALMEVINTANVWRYMTKPWQHNDVIITLRNACELYQKEQERQQLLLELTIKNKDLRELNETLEQKVIERTWIIEKQKELLNLLVDNTDIKAITNAFIGVLQEIYPTSKVYLYRAFGGKKEFITDSKIPASIEEFALKSTLNENAVLSGNSVLLPIIQLETLLGAVIFDRIPDDFDLHQNTVSQHFLPIAAIALSQYKAIEEAPAVMKNIDDLIGDI